MFEPEEYYYDEPWFFEDFDDLMRCIELDNKYQNEDNDWLDLPYQDYDEEDEEY